MQNVMSALPPKRTRAVQVGMSALCQKRTSLAEGGMSVEGPNAAQHEISDVVIGVDRSIGDRGEDRDRAGREENGALGYRAHIGAIAGQGAAKLLSAKYSTTDTPEYFL